MMAHNNWSVESLDTVWYVQHYLSDSEIATKEDELHKFNDSLSLTTSLDVTQVVDLWGVTDIISKPSSNSPEDRYDRAMASIQ